MKQLFVVSSEWHCLLNGSSSRIDCQITYRVWAELYLKTGDIRLLCKAYNGRCVAQWLAETVAAAAQDAQFQAADATNTIAVVAVTMIFGGKC